jgi:hypothetical protein
MAKAWCSGLNIVALPLQNTSGVCLDATLVNQNKQHIEAIVGLPEGGKTGIILRKYQFEIWQYLQPAPDNFPLF